MPSPPWRSREPRSWGEAGWPLERLSLQRAPEDTVARGPLLPRVSSRWARLVGSGRRETTRVGRDRMRVAHAPLPGAGVRRRDVEACAPPQTGFWIANLAPGSRPPPAPQRARSSASARVRQWYRGGGAQKRRIYIPSLRLSTKTPTQLRPVRVISRLWTLHLAISTQLTSSSLPWSARPSGRFGGPGAFPCLWAR